MAKFLDDLTKQNKALTSKIEGFFSDLDNLYGHNVPHHRSMIGTAVDEITLEIRKAKEGGHTGTKLADFSSVAPVRKAHKAAQDFAKDYQKAKERGEKLTADLEKAMNDMAKLIMDSEKELKRRDFNAKFGVDSKSRDKIDSLMKSMTDALKDHARSLKTVQAQAPKKTGDQRLKESLALVTVDDTDFERNKADKGLYARLVDLRVVNKYQREAQAAFDGTIASLTQAVEASRAGDAAAAKKAMKDAGTSMKALTKTADFLTAAVASYTKNGSSASDKEMRPLFKAEGTVRDMVNRAVEEGKSARKSVTEDA